METIVVLLTSRLNQQIENDGTKVAKYRETVNMAIEFTFKELFDGVHTPRTCLLRAVCVLLCNAPDKDWNHEEELKGWGLGNARSCRPTVSVAMNSLMREKDNRSLCSGSIPDWD